VRIYTKVFRAVTYYMLGIFLLFSSFTFIAQNFIGLIKVFGAFIVWFALYNYLKKQKSYAFLLSFSIVSLFWFPLLYRTYERIVFINVNDGFERADGYGSPLAFLMGFTFELMFFIPLSILFLFGLYVIFKGEKS